MPFCPLRGVAPSLPPKGGRRLGSLAQLPFPGTGSCHLSLLWWLVLWRSPAPDRLLEAHVSVFTRKAQHPVEDGCPREGLLPRSSPAGDPSLSGDACSLSSLASPNPSRRWGVRPLCWYGNHFISRIWEEPDLPVSGYCGALSRSCQVCRAWGVEAWAPWPGRGRPTGPPILAWEPVSRGPRASRAEEGAGSFINRGFLWLQPPPPAAAILQGAASDSAVISL